MSPNLTSDPAAWLSIHPEVAEALAEGRPVVALESTVITHGLPRPANLELAIEMEARVRAHGAVPATVGILGGEVHLGLAPEQLEHLALHAQARKVSRRDLAIAASQGLDGGTTVAGTLFVAHAGGVRVFATGGIGGVHRGDGGDVSADLPALAETPLAVVCAGAKAILDLPRTLEWLETAGVPVAGWQTDEFPAFFSRSSGLPVPLRVDAMADLAALVQAHWRLGLKSAVLVGVPCPASEAIPPETLEAALEQAENEAAEAGIRGALLTPFLLSRVAQLTDESSLRANLALLRQNAEIASDLAVILA